jgi:hypothetical protein
LFAVNPVNLLLVVFTLTVNLTVNRARAREEEALTKARLWNICPSCYKYTKARFIDRRKQCPFCFSPMTPLIDFFGEGKAIEEAREEMRFRKQLQYEERDARRRKLASAPSHPVIRETEGIDEEGTEEGL